MWTGIGIAAGAIGGALLNSNAAGKASNAQTAGAGQSIAEQRREYDQTRADNAPFLSTGTAANRRLAVMLGLPNVGPDQNDPRYKALLDPMLADLDQQHIKKFGMSMYDPRADASGVNAWTTQAKQRAATQYAQQYGDTNASDPASGSLLKKFGTEDLNADPVYQSGLQFGLDQGAGAINARATQGGMYDSGATIKALTRFGNDYGSTKANESYNRYTNDQNNIFNRLSGVSGSGQVASNQISAAGSNMATNVGNAYEGAGNARAAGIVGGANAWGGAINNANAGYNNYLNNQRLNALMARYPGAGGGASPTGNSDWYAG